MSLPTFPFWLISHYAGSVCLVIRLCRDRSATSDLPLCNLPEKSKKIFITDYILADHIPTHQNSATALKDCTRLRVLYRDALNQWSRKARTHCGMLRFSAVLTNKRAKCRPGRTDLRQSGTRNAKIILQSRLRGDRSTPGRTSCPIL